MRGAGRLRAVAPVLILIVLSSCAGRGINAGEEGGRAFIAFTVMLLATIGLLYVTIGRGD